MVTRMRAAAQMALGDKNALRVDRGQGLYIVPVQSLVDGNQCRAIARLQKQRFEAEVRGEWLVITPATSWIEAVRDELLQNWSKAMSPLMNSLRFGLSRAVEEADYKLWIWGMKFLEMPFGDSEKAAFERKVRQRAAQALRQGKFGGTLWDCAAVCKLIDGCEKNMAY